MGAPTQAGEVSTGRLTDQDDRAEHWRAWLDIDWCDYLRQIEIWNRKINCVDIGEGDAIVFIHGLGGSWQNWLGNIPFFSKNHRVLALDLPGFGLSEMPARPLSIPDYGRLIAQLCERLQLGKICLVGNSMGGLISAETAVSFPELVRRLVLVSPAGISSGKLSAAGTRRAMLSTASLASAARLWRAVGARVSVNLESAARRPRLRRVLMTMVFHDPGCAPPELVYEQLKGGAIRPGVVDATKAVLSYDIRPRLGGIEAPTLVVWGRHDRIIPYRLGDAEEYVRLIPDARKEVFEDTGHVTQLERPERFNRLVAEFLREDGK